MNVRFCEPFGGGKDFVARMKDFAFQGGTCWSHMLGPQYRLRLPLMHIPIGSLFWLLLSVGRLLTFVSRKTCSKRALRD